MSAATAPERRERMPRAERERQMLEVAERVFAERGYHAASMDDIAEQVGVSKPMLYEYFGSKEGLLVAGIRRVRNELLERTARAIEGVTTPEQALRRGLRAFFEFSEDHALGWRVIRHETSVSEGPAADEIEGIRREQAMWIARLIEAYDGRPPSPPTEFEAYAEALVGAAERLAIWREGHPEVTADEATESLMTFAWAGLASLVPAEGS
jgi:AcrR family transcriptional regulator